MTPEEFKIKMLAINNDLMHDPERAHIVADELMCSLLRELGYEDGVDVFENMDIWYS